MNLLIITQKVDATDSNLGFFVRWIEEFAKRCLQVTVICLEKRVYELPAHVAVFSLGKNPHADSRGWRRGFARIVYTLRLVRYIIREREGYDAVFVHMAPEYAILGGLFWRLAGKKSALWYVHKEVSLRLRLAAVLVDKIFTASKESCRLRNKKVEVVGHGIDSNTNYEQDAKLRKGTSATPHLITVGRISPVKDIKTLLLGFRELQKSFPDAQFSIIGEPITNADRMYLQEVRHIVSAGVQFRGGVSHDELPRYYAAATVFVHASKTGSMDKAVLEALAAGLPVFTSSEAFTETRINADTANRGFPQMERTRMNADGEDADKRGLDIGIHSFRAGDPKDFAEEISRAFLRKELVVNERGKAYVRENHSLNLLAQKIISFYE